MSFTDPCKKSALLGFLQTFAIKNFKVPKLPDLVYVRIYTIAARPCYAVALSNLASLKGFFSFNNKQKIVPSAVAVQIAIVCAAKG